MSDEPQGFGWVGNLVLFLSVMAFMIPFSIIPSCRAIDECEDGGKVVRGVLAFECVEKPVTP